MNVVIVGAGGHGRVVLDIITNSHQFQAAGFLDANRALTGQIVDGLPVLGDLSHADKLIPEGITGAIVAIGDNAIRGEYAQRLEKAGLNLVCAIHPHASLAGTAHIGRNVVIAAGAHVCAHARIGDSVILNTGSIVEHESRIENTAHICPGVRLAGHVTVQRGAFVGIGATVIQNITIGEGATVGAGAVVLEDVAAQATVVGVPARVVGVSTVRGPAGVDQRGVVRESATPTDVARRIEAAFARRPVRRRPRELPTVGSESDL